MDPRTNPAARIVRAAFALRHALQESFREARLAATPAEWMLLNLLAHAGSQRVGDIARLSRHDRTTITRVVDGLVRRGLLDRGRDPKDRRVVRVALSRRGRTLHGKLLPRARGVLEIAFDGVPAKDRKALYSALTRFHDNLVALGD